MQPTGPLAFVNRGLFKKKSHPPRTQPAEWNAHTEKRDRTHRADEERRSDVSQVRSPCFSAACTRTHERLQIFIHRQTDRNWRILRILQFAQELYLYEIVHVQYVVIYEGKFYEGKFYYKQLTVNLLRKYFRTFVRKYFRTVRKYFRTSVSKLLLPYLRTKVHCTFVRKYLGTFVSDR